MLSSSGPRVGIDIGGTFTDCLLTKNGRLVWTKVSTLPENPDRAALQAFDSLIKRSEVLSRDVRLFVHGTTLALNTLLERKGSKCGMLITEGLRDVLELGRLRLPSINDYMAQRTPSLIDRRNIIEIRERLLASGDIFIHLDEEQVEQAAIQLVSNGVDVIIICFLHAYRNPIHERIASQVIQSQYPRMLIWSSSEVWPEQGEYERFITTTINAYIGPKVQHYIRGMTNGIKSNGFVGQFFLTKSNGGVMSAETAERVPVSMLLSGPSTGVVGALRIAKQAGIEKAIAFDMGGTSADISVLDNRIPYSFDMEIANLPVCMPAVDIFSIGAGGGSIARLDPAGVMKVGPQSSGSVPGPACYGLGGRDPTVTDAYVTAGIISPENFLGGQMKLDVDAASKAISGELKGPAHEMACQVLDVATATMYGRFAPYLARLGVDPKEFALIAYGGAGPTHGFMLARELGIPQVLVPPRPGLLCAFGCLIADLRTDYVFSVLSEVEDTIFEKLGDAVNTLIDRAKVETTQESLEGENIFLWSADMRYWGQTATIQVPLSEQIICKPGEIIECFHQRYLELHGRSQKGSRVELINLRLQVLSPTSHDEEIFNGWFPGDGNDVRNPTQRVVYYENNALETKVLWRWAMHPGEKITGPVVVEQEDSTVFAPPGWEISLDNHRNLRGNLL